MADTAPWATRVGGRLVVVEADTVLEAQTATGLVFEGFHPATDAELDEWNAIVDDPLEAHDVETVLRMLRRRTREAGRKRLQHRRRGRTDIAPEHDVNRSNAVRWVVLAAKLEAMLADTSSEREAA